MKGNRTTIFKPINISMDDMDRYEDKKSFKKRTFLFMLSIFLAIFLNPQKCLVVLTIQLLVFPKIR